MLGGELYQADDAALVAARRACQRLLERFNASGRPELLGELLGSLGEGATVLPRFLCDYGAHTFVNYDAILLDCAPIVIGDHVSIGPRAQFLTPLHPIDDHEARRGGWESALPIVVGDNVWVGGGVIVCAGVSIGTNTVIGAGSVVTRDVPDHVLAVGSPCRVVRDIA